MPLLCSITLRHSSYSRSLQFSKAMNRAAVEGAYESASLPQSAVAFSWFKEANSDRDILTISPKQPLAYGKGASATTPAQSYSFTLKATGNDLWGISLTPKSWGFSTLRELTLNCPPVPELTGARSNVGGSSNAGFLQFRLSPAHIENRVGFTFDCSLPFSLPLTQLISATLDAYQADGMGVVSSAPILLRNTRFAALSEMYQACFVGVTVGDPRTGQVFSSTSDPGTRSSAVTAMVAEAFQNRPTQNSRAQFCLLFSTSTDATATFSLFNLKLSLVLATE